MTLEFIGNCFSRNIFVEYRKYRIFAAFTIIIHLNCNAYEKEKSKKSCKMVQKVCMCRIFYLSLPMSTRRERAKAQNQPVEVSVTNVIQKDSKTRKEKISNYLIDMSKYVMTGVVIASLFKDLDSYKIIVYVLGLFIAFTSFGVGIVLTDKKKED